MKPEAAAVGGVDDRRGALVLGLDRVERRAGVGDRDDPADRARARERGERREDAEGEEERPGGAALVATPTALSFAAGHGFGERASVVEALPRPRPRGPDSSPLRGSPSPTNRQDTRQRTPAPRSAPSAEARRSPSRARRSDGGPGAPMTRSRTPSCGRLGDPRADALQRAQRLQRQRLVGVGRQPDRHLDRHRRRADRVVADDPAGQALVGDQQARVGAGAQPRVGQPDVLDGPGLALERDEVADPDRLDDRQQDPGDRVGQRLAGREADDGGGDRRRGQDRAGRSGRARRTRSARSRRR